MRKDYVNDKNGRAATSAKVCNVWTKCSNPLRGLNTYEVERMLQNARFGDDLRLQVAFYEIERNSPIFSICISKRIAGVLSRKWAITPTSQSEEAKAQSEAVERMFRKCDTKNADGLTEALRHLCMYTFRGRSGVKPFVKDGELLLKRLDNWNFLSYNGVNYWNPSSESVFLLGNDGYRSGTYGDLRGLGLKTIPDGEIAYVVDDKPLDWAGISIYLRLLVGEEQWARSVEKFGIPQVLLKAPAGTPETDLQKWDYRAQAIFEGASGVLPDGTEADILTAARGQDPFTEFIAHQMQMFCILATGSSLSTLGGTQGSTGAGMGSDIASVQDGQFNSLVTLDCKRISNALQVAVDRCAESMGYKETLCRFEFVEDDDTTVSEYLEWAERLQRLGVTIDVERLKALTKIDFIKDDVKDLWTPGQKGDDAVGSNAEEGL